MSVKNYAKSKSTSLSKNFKSTEFDCHGKGCCSATKIDEALVEFLQKIRDHFNKPVHISSGYRCEIHNAKPSVGGATGSRHTKGQAADIVVEDVEPAEVAKYCESIGVKGIGLYEKKDCGDDFVHIDTRSSKSFWYGHKQVYRSTFGGTIEEKKEETKKKEQKSYLSKGSTGQRVSDLQTKLNSLGFDCGYVDGIFGSKTQSAVYAFQRERNIQQDGIVGPQTEAELNAFTPYKARVTTALNLRSGPSTKYGVVTVLSKNGVYTISYEKDGWGRLKSKQGWVSLKYMEKV